jgi:hypothetical protein
MRNCLGTLLLILASLPSQAQTAVSFNRDIRPIMSDTCFRCHGPDRGSRMAGLRLDIREAALKPNRRGQIPIVPGDPNKSYIIQRIFAENEAAFMPPPSAHKELTAKQKETIRRWVAEGAPYEGHWAYEPLRKLSLPAAVSPVDHFVRARLAVEGLQPTAEAGKRTLLRRLTLDLTGLPPTPADLKAFLEDSSPNAYEKAVDRLLASNAYAEKMAMHWLDAVRYADTAGFHGDNIFPSWPYRDYVLNAFRSNMPFDRFTREQLAGDLLPSATDEQKVASAFNRLNRVSAEGGLQPKEYLAKYGADRVRTVSAVWLGATLGCAECHDHKFDPFLAKDFYAMKAFFADIKETGLVPDRGPNAWGSKLLLATPEQRSALEKAKAAADSARATLDASATISPEWAKQLLANYNAGQLAWKIQRPLTATSANGAVLTIYNEEELDMMPYFGGIIRGFRAKGNGLVVASGPNPDQETYTVTFQPGAGSWKSFGLEIVQDETLPSNAVARGGDRLMLSEVELKAGPKRTPVEFSLATSNVSQASYQQPPSAVIDGDPNTSWGPTTYGENRNLFLALRLAKPLLTDGRTVYTVVLRHQGSIRKGTLGRFRLALNAAEYAWPEGTDLSEDRKRPGGLPDEVLRAVRLESTEWKETDRKALAQYQAWADPALTPRQQALAKAESDSFYLDAAIPRSLFTETVPPVETRILPRGNFLDDSGAIVAPAIPEVFGKVASGGERATRLDLANWIVSKQNPLTPRVMVNRVWRQFFGAGLSKVLDDLGSQGELPTHLALLDWLAADFQETWDVKRLVKTIAMSQTYRQSSQPSAEALAKDPENRLYARQSRLRVDAEVVHDVALSASGLLTQRFGGPSVKPYQPEGYLGALNFPKRDYSASLGRDLYARGIYTQWQRTFLHPSLMTFDAPSREECTVNRVTSNTPLQALVLLNDPIYVEAARAFAQKMLAEGGKSLDARLDWAFERTLSRPATPEEKAVLRDLFAKSQAQFTQDPTAAKQLLTVGEWPLPPRVNASELAAATTVTRAILNLHEAITRN